MQTAQSEDTEITLGTGKMLALFFGLVAICAVFFAMGFSLGRNSVLKLSAEDAQNTTPISAAAASGCPIVTAALAGSSAATLEAIEARPGTRAADLGIRRSCLATRHWMGTQILARASRASQSTTAPRRARRVALTAAESHPIHTQEGEAVHPQHQPASRSLTV